MSPIIERVITIAIIITPQHLQLSLTSPRPMSLPTSLIVATTTAAVVAPLPPRHPSPLPCQPRSQTVACSHYRANQLFVPHIIPIFKNPKPFLLNHNQSNNKNQNIQKTEGQRVTKTPIEIYRQADRDS